MMTSISRRTALKSSAAIGLLSSFGCGRSGGGPSSVHDLGQMDAVATAQAIKNGDITALESISAAIDRAEKTDPVINAIVTPYYDSAREHAGTPPEGPWFGVPTFIKDLNKVIGQRTTYGSRAFANFIATDQSPLADAIFGAGLISLGKSASPEFGLTATTESMLEGPTLNPWNNEYSSGGSSGGAAALVAARVVPVAHASDGGGSIRIPASCCGLVGMKPSRGRMPEPDRAKGRPIYITEHCVESRTVRDTAAFIAMLEVESDLPRTGLVEGPASARRKIGFFTEAPTGVDVDPDVAAANEATAKALEALGHEIIPIASPFDAGVLQDFSIYWGAGAAQAIAGWEAATGVKADYSTYEPFTFGIVEYYEARRHLLDAAIHRLLTFERDYRAVFSAFDLLLSPVLATPPPRIGHLAPTMAFPLALERLQNYVCYTQFMNVAGAPAISLPTGVSKNDLPIGAQLAALPGNERTILEVAYELEAEMPWKDRAPKLTF